MMAANAGEATGCDLPPGFRDVKHSGVSTGLSVLREDASREYGRKSVLPEYLLRTVAAFRAQRSKHVTDADREEEMARGACKLVHWTDHTKGLDEEIRQEMAHPSIRKVYKEKRWGLFLSVLQCASHSRRLSSNM